MHNGSARSWLHSSDAVRAIEAAAHVKEYTVINIGHPDVRPMDELAEMVRKELNAPRELISYMDIPVRMTQVKRPTLERQKNILGIAPLVSLEEGVRRVCKRVPERLATGEEWR